MYSLFSNDIHFNNGAVVDLMYNSPF
jgi:hypothetical protein